MRTGGADGGKNGATPALQYCGTVYTRLGGESELRLPDTFHRVGELEAQEDAAHLRDFTSTFGGIGSGLFADPANPHSVYLKARGEYLLFVDDFLHSELVMYQNRLYQNTGGSQNWFYEEAPWGEADGYQPVGTVERVSFDTAPTQNGQSNIERSKGCEIYGSEADDSIIYLKAPDSGDSCKWIRLTRGES